MINLSNNLLRIMVHLGGQHVYNFHPLRELWMKRELVELVFTVNGICSFFTQEYKVDLHL